MKSVGMECRCIGNLVRRKLCESDVIRESQQLTGMHGYVIGYLAECGGDVYQRDLEKRFAMRRSTATQMLTLMERNGLILRETSSSDARMKKIALTDKARRLYSAVTEEIKAVEQTARQGLSESQLSAFFEVCEAIEKNLS